jgi:hypothetical protein
MHPSTHVTHIPEIDEMEPSVLFFVSVAAEEFIRENLIDMVGSSYLESCFLDFTCDARRHVAHHILELLLLEARRTEVGAAAADWTLGCREGASKLAGGTDVHAASAEPAYFRLHVERGPDAPPLAPSAESNGLCHHLLFAHADAEAAQDAVLVLLPEPLLMDAVGRGEVLDRLRLRTGGEQKLEDHLARRDNAL